ncbi:hypothetical protein K488DRAFT_91649 [Vararia minispora EC-137]|uniref:Uncharacterized protein n=1 Tax=Vararia minispora EC-137 TaxID=1314806 RepID=A0ACB8Q5A5_9AGAM|nr:hypothetical protein K488DRAFT_91649 [Vararia minispora EC-137]
MPSKNWLHEQKARLLRPFSSRFSRSPSPRPQPEPTPAVSGSQSAGGDNPDRPIRIPDASTRKSTMPELTSEPAPISNTPGDTPSKPTTEEDKATQDHSNAYKNTIRVLEGLVQLAKRIEPLVRNTPAGTPMSVFTTIVDVIEAIHGADGDAETTLNDLSDRISIIEEILANHPASQSTQRIDEYAKFLAAEEKRLCEIKGRSAWKKVLEMDSRRQEVQGIVLKIDEKTKNLSIYISLSVEKDTKAILERISKSELRGLMRAPSAVYKSDTTGNTPQREKCTEGTRVDVLKRISNWAADPSSPPIFWLSGMAGTGKSTIAYTVCHHFDSDKVGGARLCASFICSRQVEALRQRQNIIPTLAYQLARQSRSFAEAVVDADPMTLHNSGEHVEKLLVTPWKRSMKYRQDGLPLSLIVIDALDEIENNGGEQLLQELIDSIRSEGVQRLKILVTSRPHPKIVDATSSLSRSAIYRLEDIEEKDGRKDIRTFLAARLPELHTSPAREHKQ